MTDPVPQLIQSAVLVPVFRRDDGEVRLLLVRRGDQGPHGGQLAFPGGKCEPGDASPLATALREAREEVGIVREHVEVLASLPPIETLTTGFMIHPFLGRLDPPWRWEMQTGEIVEVLEVRVSEFIRPENRGEEMAHFPTWPAAKHVTFCRVGPYRLWGATYRIVESLVPHLLAGEWCI